MRDAKPEGHRINTRIQIWMRDLIQQWMVQYDKSESAVVRAALTEGLKALKRDPSPLLETPPDLEDMTPPPPPPIPFPGPGPQPQKKPKK